MSVTISGLLIVALLWISALTIWHVDSAGHLLITSAFEESINLHSERARTSIQITSSSFDENVCELEILLSNKGSTPLLDYAQMDLIIKFSGGNAAVRKFDYVDSDVSFETDTWQLQLIGNEFALEPGIWNPGEDASIKLGLELTESDETHAIAILAAPNGAITETTIGALTAPCVR